MTVGVQTSFQPLFVEEIAERDHFRYFIRRLAKATENDFLETGQIPKAFRIGNHLFHRGIAVTQPKVVTIIAGTLVTYAKIAGVRALVRQVDVQITVQNVEIGVLSILVLLLIVALILAAVLVVLVVLLLRLRLLYRRRLLLLGLVLGLIFVFVLILLALIIPVVLRILSILIILIILLLRILSGLRVLLSGLVLLGLLVLLTAVTAAVSVTSSLTSAAVALLFYVLIFFHLFSST